MSVKYLFFLETIFFIVLSGCVAENKVDRPSSWPKEKASLSECPDISGTYKNIGVSDEEGYCSIAENGEIQSECILSLLLETSWGDMTRKIPGLDLVDTAVEIDKTRDGVFKVKLYKNKQAIHEFTLGQGGRSYECKDGGIYLADLEAAYPTYSLIHVWGGFTLKPCDDSSLALELDMKAAGYTFLIPFYGHVQKWYKWECIK